MGSGYLSIVKLEKNTLSSFPEAQAGESRTNKMALVLSKEHKVYEIKWSHSCQPRWLPIIHDTLVQEGNYLSQSRHIWQGDSPKISAHVI